MRRAEHAHARECIVKVGWLGLHASWEPTASSAQAPDEAAPAPTTTGLLLARVCMLAGSRSQGHVTRMNPSSTTVAKIIELSSQSPTSFQDAIEAGVARASQTLRNIEGVWIKEQSLSVVDGKIKAYRVIMKVTFVFTE